MAEALSPVYNATSSPLIVDRAGRVLGAGEFGAVDVTTSPASGHLAEGRLLVVERPGGDTDLDEGAAAAFDAASTTTTAPRQRRTTEES